MKLLSRKTFKEAGFARDHNQCLVCKAPAVDFHHIIERKAFSDGGYFIDNGASVCSSCHFKAEQTLISCEELRTKAGIKEIVLPSGVDRSLVYDKWLNIIRDDGFRIPGPLFYLEGVQKVLKPVLHLFLVNHPEPKVFR